MLTKKKFDNEKEIPLFLEKRREIQTHKNHIHANIRLQKERKEKKWYQHYLLNYNIDMRTSVLNNYLLL